MSLGVTPIKATKSGPDDGADMRLRIVKAGFHLFLRLGENKTSMADIADAAGVSRATVYRHFRERDDLLGAVWRHSAHVYWDAIDARITDDMSLGDKIETRARMMIRRTRGLVNQLTSGSVEMYRRMMGEDLAETSSVSIERTIPMLELAKARGELRADVDVRVAADWITRAMLSLIWLPVSTVVDLSDDVAGPRYAREFIMQGIGARE